MSKSPSSSLFDHPDKLMALIQKSVHRAVLEHKRNGIPVAIGLPDGTVRIVQPDDINLPDPDAQEK